MISRLEPVKNIKAVLNVMKRLVKLNHKVHLTIAGSGSLDKELRDQVKHQKLDNHVNFIGFITDPYPHLLTSDLYVLNSFTEGFSNSLVEAMYSRTPALSTSVGSVPEIIKDGENGFLVEPDNEDLLVDKILEIMKTPKGHLLQIGKSGHKTVVNNFSLEKHIFELMKIYKN
ncbi:glycosyltransferase [Weeksellaceae bacterium KMM 9724]|nr:glycosyltransferase [Profundicola chukchiensis]